MQFRSAPILVCFALAAADCSWDAAPTSDFITFGAGNSLATAQVEQSRNMWPPEALDNNLTFDAEQLLQPPQSDAPSAPQGMAAPSAGISSPQQ